MYESGFPIACLASDRFSLQVQLRKSPVPWNRPRQVRRQDRGDNGIIEALYSSFPILHFQLLAPLSPSSTTFRATACILCNILGLSLGHLKCFL